MIIRRSEDLSARVGLLLVVAFGAAPSVAAEPLLPAYVRVDLTLTSNKPAQLNEQLVDFQLPLRLHLGYEPGKPLRQLWFSRERVNVSVAEAQQEARSALAATGTEAEAAARAAAQAAKAAEAANLRHLLPLAIQQRHRDASKLGCSADRIKGIVKFAWRTGARADAIPGWAVGSLELDVAMSDGTAKGTFTRSVTSYTLDREGNKDGLKESVETGTVSGTVRGAADLATSYGIGTGKDITAFPGNIGGKGFPSYDGKIVQKVDDARLVWVSEQSTAISWRDNSINFSGGYAPPLLWNGRIYQYYFQPKPGGTDIRPGKYTEKRIPGCEPDPEVGAKTWASWHVKEAQEVVVCVDAATGATLWKRVLDFGGALNYGEDGSKGGPFQVPCIADGRIFVQGTVGQLYCLDALTGQTVWEDKRAKFSKCKLFSLQCVDGVLLTAGKKGLAGVDPKTGKQLWENRGGGGGARGREGTISAVPWTHDGKTYFLDDSGLYDPRTGKQLWSFPEGANMRFPTVCGDVAFVRVATNSGARRICTTLRAFCISPAGCKQLWAHPDGASLSRFCHPSVVSGRVYGKLDNTNGGSTGEYVKKTFCTNLETGRTLLAGTGKGGDPFGQPGYCLGAANGLVLGNGSGFLRVLPDAPYMEPFGDLGYAPNNCMMPIYSDGRWFKRTNYGHIVCIDMRAEREAPQMVSVDSPRTGVHDHEPHTDRGDGR